MFLAKTIASEHKDLIHDVSFDYYGRRMATCSSDHTVKVWDLDDNDQWQCTASWRSHSGSVWRVTWAHPEFGQVLATCSFDRTAAVWEELSSEASGAKSSSNTWIKKNSLVDSRTSVTDIRFAPKHFGLQLATCSAEGIVRIYEAVDVMNLSNWPVQYEFNCNLCLSCLSWNPSRMHAPMIAVGSDSSDQSAGGKVLIFEFNEAARRWEKVETIFKVTEPVHDVRFAPNLGRAYHLLAIAAKELTIISLTSVKKDGSVNPGALSKFETRQIGCFEDHESLVWRVSWNITGTILASSGDDGCVRLWKANYLGNWKCFSILKPDNKASEAEQASMSVAGAAMSTTPTSGAGRVVPPAGMMNIKRSSGWPFMHIKEDQGKMFY